MSLKYTSHANMIIDIRSISEFQIIERVNNFYFQHLQNLVNFLLLFGLLCVITNIISNGIDVLSCSYDTHHF